VKRIKHNDLTHYFLRPHSELPRAYLVSCEKFFDSICWPRYYGGGPSLNHKIYRLKKPQASSNKPQASSLTAQGSGTIKDLEREKYYENN
jgi:hypothetical protein